MIVFGGHIPPYVTSNDVWVLTDADGVSGTSQWINLIPNGALGSPAPRSGHSAVYDPASNRMTVFGGCSGGCFPINNDVWVLTNANGLGGAPSWIQLFPVGGPPQGRVRHTAVYDPGSNRMIVFGGQNGGGFGGSTFPEVWILDHANGLGGTPTWILVGTAGGPPPGEYAPSAVYDPATNRMTVFGGGALGTGAPTNAVWVLTNANGLGGTPTWINLIPEGAAGAPEPRAFHTAVYDKSTNRMTVFGSGPTGNDAWVLSSANGLGGPPSWSQLAPSGGPPAPRSTHAAVYNPGSNRMTIFAGAGYDCCTLVFLNDTWVLSERVVIDVAIDIKPGSFPNSINLGSSGSVPVAILSTPLFDAGQVDPTTVTLADAAVRVRRNRTPMAAMEDVNGDGLLDLVLHVSTQALQLSESDTEAVLWGRTFDGTAVRGSDSVRVVP